MLEKIGLPAKPSLRGSNWVVDASHCQGCSSQFTFINRKHHCRRCGGLFCNSCTQQRMVLRGQGDSAVRICESCKKLEEAARFEMRQGRRAGRGSLKSAPSNEDEVLSQILGLDREQSSSSQRSSSNTKAAVNEDDGDLQKIVSDKKPNDMRIDVASSNPDDLRQQALEEKRKYKILKADRKPDEALRAFKRGKELERQADALEVHLRKIRKKILPSGKSDMQNKDFQIESVRKTKSLSHMGKEKDDLTAELRGLGWSDMELHSEDKKSANLSLEGELSSLIGEISPNTGKEKGSGIDKTEVVALKKKALMLKREGKPAEAKEELKKAKLLEKQLEEQELLAEADDSDDELSALIRSIDNNKEEFSLHNNKHDLDLGHLVGISDDLLDDNFEVTDQDMMDPEIAAALESIGWTEDSGHPENIFSESQPLDGEALLSEIQSLKREALAQKRLGNTAEAMAFLKKAKLLEKDLNSSGSQENDTMVQSASSKGVSSQVSGSSINNAASMPTPKSRLMIQKELLSLKKKALTLRREGKLTGAEEELRKCAALERQLEEMDIASNLKASQVNIGGDFSHSANKHPDILKDLPPGKEGGDDVTDQDMSDPTYVSLLKDLGWNDENNELSYSSNKPSNKDSDHSVPIDETSPNNHLISISVGATRRSKFEIQRELLGLKRKALALRREGKIEDAEDVLKMAKDLEACMEEVEGPKKEVQVEATRFKGKLLNHPDECAVEEGGDEVVTEEDMHDPALHLMLTNIGWKDEEHQLVAIKGESVKEAASSSKNSLDLPVLNSSSGIPGTASRSKGEIQRELLVLKRKALAHRRKGEMEEAEEVFKMAKKLEDQFEDFGTHKKDESPVLSESSTFQNKHGNREIVTELDKGSALSGSLIPPTSQLPDDMHLSSVEVGASGKNPAEHIKAAEISAGHTIKTQDLLTADSWSSSDILTQKQRDLKLSSENFSQASPPIHLDSSMTFNQDQGGKNNILTQKKGDLIVADEKPSGPNAAVQDYASQHLVCKNNISTQKKGDLIVADEKPSGPNAAVQDYASQHLVSFHQEILAHKRKAVSLKREGKLAEAREELRQAKLLEKSLENGNVQSTTAPTVSSDASHVVEKKQNSPPIAAKPLSSRDRFKLQQESLAHKRQALKLRREGRMEEAEAEFEQAKALETQLEELAVQDSSSKSDTVDDVTVEDFLDPQLLSALKAVGLDNVSAVSRGLERQEPAKPDVAKTENCDQERVQLVERIKAEKLKAVNLKRSGKQAEALDALRQAKLYEKKLNSLTSG